MGPGFREQPPKPLYNYTPCRWRCILMGDGEGGHSTGLKETVCIVGEERDGTDSAHKLRNA